MVYVFSSIYALCYVDCFVDIELTIHTWDESNSVMVHDLKEFLDSISKGFFWELFCLLGSSQKLVCGSFLIFLCPFMVLEL